MKHPTFKKLVDYVEKKLSADETKHINVHVTMCAQCETELNRAKYLVTTQQEDDLIAPESNLLNRVITAFRRQKNRLPNRPQLKASLEFDSGTQMAALGARGTVQERQLLFSEDMYDVDLQIMKDSPNGSTFTLHGQFLPIDETSEFANLDGIEVRIMDAADIERRVLTDSLGQFSFYQLPEKVYTVNLIFENHDITLEDIVFTTK